MEGKVVGGVVSENQKGEGKGSGRYLKSLLAKVLEDGTLVELVDALPCV